TLVMNKSSGATAIGASTLTIGDDIGGADADTLALAAAGQFASGASVVVKSSGRLDGGAQITVVSSLAMTSGDVVNPFLRLTGNVSRNAHPLAGTIATGTLDFFGVIRTFTVADGAALSDLDVSARLTNGGIIK